MVMLTAFAPAPRPVIWSAPLVSLTSVATAPRPVIWSAPLVNRTSVAPAPRPVIWSAPLVNRTSVAPAPRPVIWSAPVVTTRVLGAAVEADVHARESIATHRPSRLLGDAAICRHDELDAIARCQIDGGLLVAHEKTIGDEVHRSLESHVSVQDRRPLISLEIPRTALRGAQIFRIE